MFDHSIFFLSPSSNLYLPFPFLTYSQTFPSLSRSQHPSRSVNFLC